MTTIFEIAGNRFVPDGVVAYEKPAPPLVVDPEFGAYYDPTNIPPIRFLIAGHLFASVPAYACDNLSFTQQGDEMVISLPHETSFGPGLKRISPVTS